MTEENSPNLIEAMAGEIRTVYNSDIAHAEASIENYVNSKLKEYSSGERLNFLIDLAQKFNNRCALPQADDIEVMVDEIRKIYNSDTVRAESSIENYVKSKQKGYSSGERVNLLIDLAQQFESHSTLPQTDFNTIDIEVVAGEIRTVYNSDIAHAESSIGNYVKSKLKGYSSGEKVNFLTNLARQFKNRNALPKENFNIKAEEFSQLLSLLLGKDIPITELSEPELLEKLAESLNTVFDTLNEIIHVIHTTLLGKKTEHQTIRGIISSNLNSEMVTGTLEDHLNQIKDAFSISHEAFQHAAHTKIKTVLDGLEPDRIAATSEGGLFRKANLFNNYKDEFAKCKRWFDSGRYKEELLREFEKKCQELYKTKRKR